jgi:hypothetical protein
VHCQAVREPEQTVSNVRGQHGPMQARGVPAPENFRQGGERTDVVDGQDGNRSGTPAEVAVGLILSTGLAVLVQFSTVQVEEGSHARQFSKYDHGIYASAEQCSIVNTYSCCCLQHGQQHTCTCTAIQKAAS